MLNVKPINRPTIPKLLKSAYIRPKAANYIKDYIKNYKLYDGNEEQVLILKEQAEKYSIFKTKLYREIKENSQEKEIKLKKNNYNNNKKIRNKNSNSNISANKKNNKRLDYVSDDNKKKHYNNYNNKNKETLNPSYNYNNCHRIKYSLSKNKNGRASSRPLSSQKIENNNNNLIVKEHNI